MVVGEGLLLDIFSDSFQIAYYFHVRVRFMFVCQSNDGVVSFNNFCPLLIESLIFLL